MDVQELEEQGIITIRNECASVMERMQLQQVGPQPFLPAIYLEVMIGLSDTVEKCNGLLDQIWAKNNPCSNGKFIQLEFSFMVDVWIDVGEIPF